MHRLQGRLAVAHRSRHLDRRILLQRARQQAADDRRVIDHHDAVRISSVSAGAAGGGLRFRHQMRPTWTNFEQMMSLSKGFIMSSLAPDSIAVLMCSMSFSVVQKTTIGRSEEHTSEIQPLMRISYAVF